MARSAKKLRDERSSGKELPDALSAAHPALVGLVRLLARQAAQEHHNRDLDEQGEDIHAQTE